MLFLSRKTRWWELNSLLWQYNREQVAAVLRLSCAPRIYWAKNVWIVFKWEGVDTGISQIVNKRTKERQIGLSRREYRAVLIVRVGS